jgi:hypothetical protein
MNYKYINIGQVPDPLGQLNNRVPHSSVQPLSGNIGQELMNEANGGYTLITKHFITR